MPTSATFAVERLNLFSRAELALQSILRAWQKPQSETTWELIPPHQATLHTEIQPKVADLVDCRQPSSKVQGEDILEIHRSAEIKVDAAEYAFTMMLAELSGAMETPPTAWKPSRELPAPDSCTIVDFAVCAA